MHERRVSRPAVASLVAVLALGGTAVAADKKKKKDYHAAAVEMLKASFQTRGQASVDRLNQDEVQATCSQYNASKPVPKDLARKLQEAQLATVQYPSDGKYLGSWESGEKIAQTGVGKQFSDDPSKPAGGNCYACHQLSPKELSFGTIGPSLYQYGKLRGNSEPILKYTWARIWNPHAFQACSDMPRFGHQGILTEQQIKDVMALLLDPESPVNK